MSSVDEFMIPFLVGARECSLRSGTLLTQMTSGAVGEPHILKMTCCHRGSLASAGLP